jgi:hypothetical protein
MQVTTVGIDRKVRVYREGRLVLRKQPAATLCLRRQPTAVCGGNGGLCQRITGRARLRSSVIRFC